MRLPGFPTDSERKKDMARGAFVGMLVPTLILGAIMLRQLGGDNTVSARDSGAPLEVQERPRPIVKRAPVRKVYSRGANRTVAFNNPYLRGNTAAALLARNGTAGTLAKPWELREAKFNKQQEQKAINVKSKLGKSALKAAMKARTAAAAAEAEKNGGGGEAPAPPPKLAKATKVFDASTGGKGFAPGDAVGPAEGTKLTSLKAFTKVAVASKCVGVVGFYNSRDAEMSREFAAVWNSVAATEANSFSVAYVDIATTGGLEIAVNATVAVTEDDKSGKAPIGTPAILAFSVRGDASRFKTIYKNAREVGVAASQAGKEKEKDAVPVEDATAQIIKKLVNHASNQNFASAKEGCFEKYATVADADAADAARKEDKAQKAKAKEKQAKITEKAKKKGGDLDAKLEAAAQV